jgi:hypothetical protein
LRGVLQSLWHASAHPRLAKELKRSSEAYGYAEWIHNVTQDLDFQQLIKGLSWFANSNCPDCLEGSGMPHCEARSCCLKRKLKNCHFCPDFSRCEKLNYQKATYDVKRHFERIERIGYENWLREQGKKTDQNFDNIQYLEKKQGND